MDGSYKFKTFFKDDLYIGPSKVKIDFERGRRATVPKNIMFIPEVNPSEHALMMTQTKYKESNALEARLLMKRHIDDYLELISPEKFEISYLGRFDQERRVHFTEEALNYISPIHKNYSHLLFLGRGDHMIIKPLYED